MVIFFFFWLLATSPNLGILILFSLGFLEFKFSGIVFYFLWKRLSGGTGLGQLQCLGRSGTAEVCVWLIGWVWPACLSLLGIALVLPFFSGSAPHVSSKDPGSASQFSLT